MPPNARHNPVPLPLKDSERASIEQAAFNFHRDYGQPMRIPPTLFDDLRRAGVNMRHMVADAGLELGPPPN